MRSLSFLKILALVLFVLSCSGHVKNEVKEKKFYGENFQASKVLEIDKVVQNYNTYKDQEIIMKAQVQSVCKKKGCWMILGSKENSDVRVTFKDYGFFVPISLVNKDVVLKGKLSKKKVKEDLIKHYLEDQGLSKSEIDAHKGDVYELSFLASGVKAL